MKQQREVILGQPEVNLGYFGPASKIPNFSIVSFIVKRIEYLVGIKIDHVFVIHNKSKFQATAFSCKTPLGELVLGLDPYFIGKKSSFLTSVIAHEFAHLVQGHHTSTSKDLCIDEFEAISYQSLIFPLEDLIHQAEKHAGWRDHFIQKFYRFIEKEPTYPTDRQNHHFMQTLYKSVIDSDYQHPFLSTTLSSGRVTLFPGYSDVALEDWRVAAVSLAKEQAARFVAKEPLPDVFGFLQAALTERGAGMTRLEGLSDRAPATRFEPEM